MKIPKYRKESTYEIDDCRNRRDIGVDCGSGVRRCDSAVYRFRQDRREVCLFMRLYKSDSMCKRQMRCQMHALHHMRTGLRTRVSRLSGQADSVRRRMLVPDRDGCQIRCCKRQHESCMRQDRRGGVYPLSAFFLAKHSSQDMSVTSRSTCSVNRHPQTSRRRAP